MKIENSSLSATDLEYVLKSVDSIIDILGDLHRFTWSRDRDPRATNISKVGEVAELFDSIPTNTVSARIFEIRGALLERIKEIPQ